MNKIIRILIGFLFVVVCLNTAALNWQMECYDTNRKMNEILQDNRFMTCETAVGGIINYLEPVSYMIERVVPTVVVITVSRYENDQRRVSRSSGVLVGDGLVLTCKHVVEAITDMADCAVTTKDGTVAGIVEFVSDPNNDIALIKLNIHTIVAIDIAQNPNLRPGDPVWVIGCPLKFDWSVSSGCISSLRDSSTIHLDVGVYPGNSGGPVLDRFGRLVGIVSFYYCGTDIGGVVSAGAINAAMPSLIEQLNGR